MTTGLESQSTEELTVHLRNCRQGIANIFGLSEEKRTAYSGKDSSPLAQLTGKWMIASIFETELISRGIDISLPEFGPYITVDESNKEMWRFCLLSP